MLWDSFPPDLIRSSDCLGSFKDALLTQLCFAIDDLQLDFSGSYLLSSLLKVSQRMIVIESTILRDASMSLWTL